MAVLRTRLTPAAGPLYLAPKPSKPAAPVRTVSFLARAQLLYPLAVPGGVLCLALVPPVGIGAWNGAVLGTAIGRVLFLYPWLVLAFLAGVFLLVGAWQRWRSRRHPLDPILAVWRSQVADPEDRTACLPGSRVWGPVRRHDWGWELDGDGAGTKQSNDTVRAALGGIAAAYRQPTEAFTVLDRTGNGGFTLVFRDPAVSARERAERDRRLNLMYPLAGQAMDPDGRAEVAVRVEGAGTGAAWQVFTPGVGAWHGIVAGDTRKGKSTFLEVLAVVMCRSGIVAPAFVDLAGGVTFDRWRGRGVGFADDVRGAERLLEALHREYEQRLLVIKAHPEWRGVWRPSVARPLIPVFVDEGPELKGSAKASAALQRAVRLWSKAGMCVVFATQSLTIESILGKEAGSAAKAQLMAGNQAVFYSEFGLAGVSFPVDDLPPLPGVLKLRGPAEPSPVLVRGLYAEDLDAQIASLEVPAFGWPAEPVLVRADPHGDPEPPLNVVRSVVREMPRSNRDAVLGALRSLGSAPSSEVIEVSGVPQASAYRAFSGLVQEGLAVSPSRGVWAMREQQ